MFIPPPSPFLFLEKSGADVSSPCSILPDHSRETRRHCTVRIKWSILLVPLVLIIITLSTRYIAHPAFFDALSGSQIRDPEWSYWDLHKRHPDTQPDANVSSPTISSSPVASPTSPSTSTSSDVPTIPTNPALPTPFPQPFDTTLSANFSTDSCLNFYTNMTQSAAFRQCRAFGLLLETSSAFINAQGNTSLLNDMVWGTCNTDLEFPQCTANMNWFANSLTTECAVELADRNVFVANSLTGLLVYSLMRNIGCQFDPSNNAYCYVSAVANSNPSDLFYYQLPFGISLPNNTIPSCSPCTKTIMGRYLVTVLGADPDTTNDEVRTSLAKIYGSASELSVKVCGSDYVQTTTTISGGIHLVEHGLWMIILCVVGVMNLLL